jgi:hypothetical protein
MGQTFMRELLGSKAGASSTVAATAFPLDQDIEGAAWAREFGRHAGEGQALFDAVTIGSRGGDADAALPVKYGLAAAHVGVGGGDFGVDDFQGAGRLLQSCRLADEIALVEIDEARHVGFEHVDLIGEFGGPGLVGLFHAHAVDGVQAVVGNAEGLALGPERVVQGAHGRHGRVQLPSRVRPRSSRAAPVRVDPPR